jgi:hypothetical protein
VDNTADATAAGALFSDAAGKIAVLAKSARNRFIRLRCPRLRDVLGLPSQTKAPLHKAAFLWHKFPNLCLDS